MTTPAPASITVPAHELRRALAAVLPHTGRDDTRPSLTCVRFEYAAGWLYLAAIDQYTLAAARIRTCPASSLPPGDAARQLPRRSAKALRRMLRECPDAAVVTFTADGITVAADGDSATWATRSNGSFPGWREMLAKILAAPPAELDSPHRVNARMLVRFTTPAEDGPFDGGVLSVRFAAGGAIAGVTKPVMVATRGTWFCGVLVSARRDPEDGAGSWAAALGQPAGTVAEDE